MHLNTAKYRNTRTQRTALWDIIIVIKYFCAIVLCGAWFCEEHTMNELKIKAVKENLAQVTDFIDCLLDEAGCPLKIRMKIDLAVEEIFVNIALYAYAPGSGDVTVKVDFNDDRSQVLITFTDSGIPYDPLAKDDPDVTLSSQERQVGGLGIFLIKTYMDDIRYEYAAGTNNLTVVKNLV